MKIYTTILLLFCLVTACAQQDKSAAASQERKISISPADFKGGYPAVLFNLQEGTIVAVKGQSEPEMLAALADRSLYFFIEPNDPEFNSLDEDGDDVSVTFAGYGDNSYLHFKKQGKKISTSKRIERKDFGKGNVFYLQTGKARYILQILQFNKEAQTLAFRYRKLAD